MNYYTPPKQKKGIGCLIPIIAIVVIGIVGTAITNLGLASKLTDYMDRLTYRTSSETTLNEKIQELVSIGDFAEVAIYLEENDWYTITDQKTAEAVLAAVSQGKINTKNNGTYYGSDYENADAVLQRLDCPQAKNLTAVKDNFYYKYGIKYLGGKYEKAFELLKNCSDGSNGNMLYLGFQALYNGDVLTAADYLKNCDRESVNGSNYYDLFREYKLAANITDFATYFDYETATARMYPYDSSKDITDSDFALYDHHQMANDPMPEEVRKALSKEFTGDNQGKVLILNKVTDYETNTDSLEVNTIMTQHLPAEYRPESVEDVGYIIVVDYGYRNDGIWYAGTAVATVYEVSSGEICYTSEKLYADYKTFYYGKQTDYIFSSYPDITSILLESLQAIEAQ